MNKVGRGRPRQYDRAESLNLAMGIFAEKGFTGTSLDDLAAATGMNRPSIYNAFGNKESFYRQTLEHFITQLRAEVGRTVVAEPDLKTALTAFYRGALEQYFARKPSPGCFFFCTAPVEALVHPEVQADMRALLRELDALLASKFEQAQAAGNFAADADVVSAAKVAQGVLHSLAIRARAGESKASLLRAADFAVAALTSFPENGNS